MPRLILFFVFIVLTATYMRAQSIINPDWLTIEDGLSQGYVKSIMQDREGFLWIGSKNGLNRYDGKKFEIFTHGPSDPNSLQGDFVSCLYDLENFILVGTKSAGLSLFHKETNKFYKFPSNNENPEISNSLEILSIKEDKLGQVWINTKYPEHLYRVRFPDNFQDQFPQDKTLLNKLEISKVSKAFDSFVIHDDFVLALDKVGQLWEIDLQSAEVNLAKDQPLLKASANNTLYVLSDGNLVITSIALNESTSEIKLFKDGRWSDIITEFHFALSVSLREKEQLLLMAESEFVAFDENLLYKKYLRLEDASFSFSNRGSAILDLVVDKSGNIWTGTPGYGLSKITFRKAKIKTYFYGFSIYVKPFVTKNSDVLIFPNAGGLFFVQGKDANTINILKPYFTGIASDNFKRKFGTEEMVYFDQNISAIVQDKNDTFWSLEKDQIIQIKKDGNSTIKQRIENGFGPVIYDSNLHSIFYFSSNSRLYQYNIDANLIKVYPFENILESGFEGLSITMTTKGHLWLGTNKGLVHAIPNDGAYLFDLIQKEDNGSVGLRNNEVTSVLEDASNSDVVWIGTRGGGLHRLDTAKSAWSYVNTKNGLPNDVIYGLLNDDDGNLWMSSNKGIIRYNPSTGSIKNFIKADGLQSNEFNTYAFGKTPDGRMIFGGIDGLNIFHPDDLTDNMFTPNVIFTGLTIDNESIEVGDSTELLNKAIPYTTEIELPFSQNSIGLEFAALEYTAPSKNRFRYYLEGAENEWAHESTDNKASYLNLSPGDYIFKIKGANGDGLWSDEITSLKINILPPWYRHTIAYVLYGLTLILGIYLLLLWRTRQLEQQTRKLEKIVKQRTKEIEQKTEALRELDKAKSTFFTNISHEFRTPLTIINGMADQIKESPEKWLNKGHSLIKQNSETLLNLINQILDLRKLESGKLKLNLIQSDIVSYVRYIIESFHVSAENKDIRMVYNTEQPEIFMDYDAEKILRIITNLVSNAIKYTPQGGEISVYLAANANNTLNIRVRDTGIGIPKDRLPQIFERFYQVDDSSIRIGEGTGIGLSLTNELVKLMNGELSVESEPNKGSIFTISIPITNTANVEEKEKSLGTLKKEEFVGKIDNWEEFSFEDRDNGLPRLLIVEDNDDVIAYLMACLDEQFQLMIAKNGQEGIEKAMEYIPDIILSDVMMPKKDGFELCEALKTAVSTSHIPIVLLTAKSDQESKLAGLVRGADAYLTKPFNKEELFLQLKNLLKIRLDLQRRYSSGEVPALEKNTPTNQEDVFIIKVKEAIEAHLDDDAFGINSLCEEIGISRAQLHRKIKALTNQSASLYIRSIKLLKAKELLKTTQLSVSEISFMVGYANPNYFTKVFSEKFGMPPSQFRE